MKPKHFQSVTPEYFDGCNLLFFRYLVHSQTLYVFLPDGEIHTAHAGERRGTEVPGEHPASSVAVNGSTCGFSFILLAVIGNSVGSAGSFICSITSLPARTAGCREIREGASVFGKADLV